MRRGLILAGLAELGFLVALGWSLGPVRPFPSLALFFAAFAGYLWAAGRGSDAPDPVRALPWVWGLGLAMRASLLPLAPELSDDVYRYLWDGHVQLSGINPYVFAPDDPALEGLRTPWHALINHAHISTIYPPAAQGAFRLVAALGGTLLAARLLWLVLDLATGWVLVHVARRTGRDPLRVAVLYLWSPLLVVETAWSGHLEVMGLLWMSLLLAVAASPRFRGPGRSGLLGGLLGLAALTKFAPAAALPPLVRRYGAWSALAFGLVVMAFYAPFLDAGGALFRGLGVYARDWRFNEGPFLLLEAVTPSGAAARRLAAAGVLGVVAWTTVHRYDAERALFWILGAGLLLSPTVHPWYVLWILPFAALRGSRGWILLTGTVFLGYWGLAAYHDTGSWPQPAWARALVWVPPLALLLKDHLARPRRLQPGESRSQGDPQVP